MLNIKKNIPLAQFTTFRIGGPAKFFVEINTENELKEALNYANDQELRYFILGGGSNILVSDNGFDGLVIKINFNNITQKGEEIKIESGAALGQVVAFCAEHGLSGMEWAAGIPGTVGGAVRGNVGAYGKRMADAMLSVNVFEFTKEVKSLSNQECGFSYRSSVFKKSSEFIIISSVLKLEKKDKEEIEKNMGEILTKRNSNQPKILRCAGCFFINPVVKNKNLVAEFEREKNVVVKDNKIPAGWLVEKVGLKGKKIGGAMISNEHANFIINTGEAKANDVIILESLVKQQVRDKLGVQLMEEVQYVGFD